MSKYLYGAAVQGIQGFIFQTNKLQEIVGASELVEQICTSLFTETVEKKCNAKFNDDNAVLNAAGNIKYIFDDEEACKSVVRVFPKTVMEFAPGITLSQSVVKFEDGDFHNAVQKLEDNLRTQRNRPMRDLNIGLMGIERSRQTGLPVTHVKGDAHMDSGTYHKLYGEIRDEKGNRLVRKNTTQKLCEKSFREAHPTKLAFDISNITGDNDWIAIIHADGNGLGRVVQKIGNSKDVFKLFSVNLDKATTDAAVQAFNEVVKKEAEMSNIVPMRPIVLSGDDHTVICRADLAIPYAKAFLEAFEKETRLLLGEMLKKNNVFTDGADHLTACAGVAFIKSSFPFHYGYRLAESLCDRAKKDTKNLCNSSQGNLPASCLMFHKVQDSFVSDYDDLLTRELMPQADISFEFGPYYLKDLCPINNRWSLDRLMKSAEKLVGKEGNAVKSHLRNWMTLLHEDPDMALQKLKRLESIVGGVTLEFVNDLTNGMKRGEEKRNGASDKNRLKTVYPVYDVLSLHTINNQKTR